MDCVVLQALLAYNEFGKDTEMLVQAWCPSLQCLLATLQLAG
jgi:hypothetical protein